MSEAVNKFVTDAREFLKGPKWKSMLTLARTIAGVFGVITKTER